MSQYDDQNDDIEFIRHVYRASSPTVTRQENRIKELEELLDLERDIKVRLEKTNADLCEQIGQLNDQIEELSLTSSQYNDVIRRRDTDLQRLRKEYEKVTLQMEMSEQDNRKRNHNSMMELSAEIDNLQKQKIKFEKEKMMLLQELEASLTQIESLSKTKINIESKLENSEIHNLRLKTMLDDQEKQLKEFSVIKTKLSEDNVNLKMQINEINHQTVSLKKSKSNLESSLDEIKKQLEEETKMKEVLQSQFHQIQGDNDQLRIQIEDETDNYHRLQNQVSKLNSDLMFMKSKYDKEITQKTEEFEEMKRRNTARINELQDELSREHLRLSSSEKAKQQLSMELREIYTDIDRVSTENERLMHELKSSENIIKELNNRLHDFDMEFTQLKTYLNKSNAENSKLKMNLEEEEQKVLSMTKEIGSLSNSLKEEKDNNRIIQKELSDLQMIRNQMEADRSNLLAALEETKERLIDSEHKMQLSHNTLLQLKGDMEQRLHEKDEELMLIKKTTQKTIEELTNTIASIENKYKTEIGKLKKKYETDIKEIQNEVTELQKENTQLNDDLKETTLKSHELEQILEEERRECNVLQEKLISSDKRKSQIQGDLDDSNRLLEASDKTRKKIQIEIEEISLKLADSQSHINLLNNEKRKLESEIVVLHNDMDDAITSKLETEDRVIKLGSEINRLNDDFKQEQENHKKCESARKGLFSELREIKTRLESRESSTSKEIQKNTQIFQERIRDLEIELENERVRSKDAQNAIRKQERSIREVQQQADDDRRTVIDLQQLLDAANGKIKSYKRQLDELESASTENLNKYKRAQKLIDEAEHRASVAERRVGTALNYMNQPISSISLSSYTKQSGTR